MATSSWGTYPALIRIGFRRVPSGRRVGARILSPSFRVLLSSANWFSWSSPPLLLAMDDEASGGDNQELNSKFEYWLLASPLLLLLPVSRYSWWNFHENHEIKFTYIFWGEIYFTKLCVCSAWLYLSPVRSTLFSIFKNKVSFIN